MEFTPTYQPALTSPMVCFGVLKQLTQLEPCTQVTDNTGGSTNVSLNITILEPTNIIYDPEVYC